MNLLILGIVRSATVCAKLRASKYGNVFLKVCSKADLKSGELRPGWRMSDVPNPLILDEMEDKTSTSHADPPRHCSDKLPMDDASMVWTRIAMITETSPSMGKDPAIRTLQNTGTSKDCRTHSVTGSTMCLINCPPSPHQDISRPCSETGSPDGQMSPTCSCSIATENRW